MLSRSIWKDLFPLALQPNIINKSVRTVHSVKKKQHFQSRKRGLTLGSSKSLNSIQDLEDLHIRAAIIIHNITASAPKLEILNKLNWNPIYKKRLACIAHQVYNESTPVSITNLLSRHVTTRNLRDNCKFKIHCPRTNALRDSFSHRASIVWNNLPVNLKSKPSLSLFKSELKKHSIKTFHFNNSAISFV